MTCSSNYAFWSSKSIKSFKSLRKPTKDCSNHSVSQPMAPRLSFFRTRNGSMRPVSIQSRWERIPADAMMTALIPFPTRSFDSRNLFSDCESITIQLSRLIHQEERIVVKICKSTRFSSLVLAVRSTMRLIIL